MYICGVLFLLYGHLGRLKALLLSHQNLKMRAPSSTVTGSVTKARNDKGLSIVLRAKVREFDDNEFSMPIVKIFSYFLPNKGTEFVVDKVKKRRKTTLKRLTIDLENALKQREWLVTGNIDTSFFSEDFIFKDPNVTVEGCEEYARGVNRLFDQEMSRAMLYSAEVDSDLPGVRVDWRCSGRVNIGPLGLDIKPYVVSTFFTVDEKNGLITYQEDKFGIPGYDIVLSALFPFLGPLLSPAAKEPGAAVLT